MTETEYTDSEGARYIAKPAPRNSAKVMSCSGCAHASKRDEPQTRGCMEAPTCIPDSGSIVWTKAASQNKKA